MAKEDVLLPVRCDCGEKFNVPIAGVELETLEFTCPGCGSTGRLTEDQIASVVASYEAAKDQARRFAANALNDIVRGIGKKRR